MGYKRGNRISVHNPFLDLQRKARYGHGKSKRYPQAFDTPAQRRVSKSVRKKLAKRTKKVNKSILDLFKP